MGNGCVYIITVMIKIRALYRNHRDVDTDVGANFTKQPQLWFGNIVRNRQIKWVEVRLRLVLRKDLYLHTPAKEIIRFDGIE